MYIKNNRAKSSSGKTSVSKLLVESKWDKEAKQSRTVTILNMSKLPPFVQAAIEQSLEDGIKVDLDSIKMDKSTDYGFFYVIYNIIKQLKIEQLFSFYFKEDVKYVLLMIIGKIIMKGSKLGIIKWIKRNRDIATKIGITDDELDRLSEKKLYSIQADIDAIQSKIEKKWNVYHKDKTDRVYFYDVTSFYLEGKTNELAEFGYNRDKKTGKKIITAGLTTNEEGFPLKLGVFKGSTNDHKTVKDELLFIKEELGAKELIFVGDRGMKIRHNLENISQNNKQGMQYISGLTLNEIKSLEKSGNMQLGLFDKELQEVEVDEKDKDGNNTGNIIRYVLCVNPVLEEEKRVQRLTLKTKALDKINEMQVMHNSKRKKCTENLQKIKQGETKSKRLKTELTEKEVDSWKYKVRKILSAYKMRKFFDIKITKEEFIVTFKDEDFEKEGVYDGKYVFETTVKKEDMDKHEVRSKYKKLQNIEHAFNVMKTKHLSIRPIFHINADTTRSHCFLGMFAYAVMNEIESKITPWLKQDRQKKQKLSIKDAIDELNNIKMVTLSVGKVEYKESKITELNHNQKSILECLGIKRISTL